MTRALTIAFLLLVGVGLLWGAGYALYWRHDIWLALSMFAAALFVLFAPVLNPPVEDASAAIPPAASNPQGVVEADVLPTHRRAA